MNKEVDFLTECDTLLYWIFNKVPKDNPDKFFNIEEIKAFCTEKNVDHSPAEILNRLRKEQLIHAVAKTEENEAIAVNMQIGGRTFCRAQNTLVSKYHADQDKKQGESAFASLTTKQDNDYESTNRLSKISLFISIISAIIALFALCNHK